jgi:NADH-quinone oxidoreductase subunit M
MVRFLLPIFPVALAELRNFIFTICAVSVLYSAVIGLVQLDLKKIVAYSSITHMNFSLLGLFSDDVLGVEGAIYSMFSHGLISAGLFFLVGALYERYKTRLISYYGGLISVMPIFSAVLFYFVLANVGIPPFRGFLAEILVVLGLAVEANKILAMVVFLSSILMTVNFFWLFNRVCSGPVSRHLTSVSDLGLTEVVASLFLMVFIIAIGLNPGLITQYLHGTVFDILTFSAIARGAL